MNSYVYYIFDMDTGYCEAFYTGGLLSRLFSKLHFNFLRLKYSSGSFVLKCAPLLDLIYFSEEFFYGEEDL